MSPRTVFLGRLIGLYSILVSLSMITHTSDLIQGTLDLLILKTISLEPKHGWAISKRIQQISNEVLQVQQGSLYPALQRLEQKRGSRPNGQKRKREEKQNSTR